jgi:RNA polymerase sigma-32 factor
MLGRDVSLDAGIDGDSHVSLGDLQKMPDQSLDEKIWRQEEIKILRDKIEELRPSLNEREIILLEERLLNEEPLTLAEIGNKYGITREAVRQAEARLMKKIKEKFESSQ